MNKHVERDQKVAYYKKGFAVMLATMTIAGGGIWAFKEFKPQPALSQASQQSLIEVETEAVKNNSKPLQVKGSIMKDWNRLSKENKVLAADLVYTSVQNTSVYYNSAVLLMEGEIQYNQTKNNSLSAADSSAWVLGFIQDIENNSLRSYNLNKNRILVLPDFKELKDDLEDGASQELKDFLVLAANAQAAEVFTEDEVDVYKAAEVYQTILDGTGVLARKHGTNSKYLQDASSLARIYHDAALGFIQTNNLTMQPDGSYKVSETTIKGLEKIAKSELGLKVEAQKFLAQVKDGKIAGEYLKTGATDSQQLFGSNVFWQGDTDLSAILNADGTANLTENGGGSQDGKEKEE